MPWSGMLRETVSLPPDETRCFCCTIYHICHVRVKVRILGGSPTLTDTKHGVDINVQFTTRLSMRILVRHNLW